MNKKTEKKIRKMQERMDNLKEDLRISLTKKDSSTVEISLPEYQKKVQELQLKIDSLQE